MQNFFRDRRTLFAIGLATIFLAIKWLFSDSLLSAAATLEEGKTGSATTAVLPLLFDGFVAAMIFIGARVVMVGEFIFGRLAGLATNTTTEPTAASSSLTATPDAKALERLVFALGDAVAANDIEAKRQLERQIRLPFALREMTDAYTAGDIELGKQVATEVESLQSRDGQARDGQLREGEAPAEPYTTPTQRKRSGGAK